MEFFLVWTAFIVAAVWFLMVRPQRRRILEHQALMASLAPGDEIVTAGGIHGRIDAVEDDDVRLEIAPGTVIRLAKRAVLRNLTDKPAPAPGAAAEPEDGTP